MKITSNGSVQVGEVFMCHLLAACWPRLPTCALHVGVGTFLLGLPWKSVCVGVCVRVLKYSSYWQREDILAGSHNLKGLFDASDLVWRSGSELDQGSRVRGLLGMVRVVPYAFESPH